MHTPPESKVPSPFKNSLELKQKRGTKTASQLAAHRKKGWTQYLLIPAATKKRGLRKVENKRLKIDMVHEPSINHRLIPATGRVPQGKKGVTGHYRPGQLGGAGEVEFPVSRLVANPVEVSGSPGPGRGSAQTIFPRGQPHRVYATDLWPASVLDNSSRSKSDRAPRQRLIVDG